MDDKTKKAFDIAEYMTTLASQKRVLFEEFVQNTILFFNGSQFKIDRELINYIKTLIDLGQTEYVLIDSNNLPVDINDLPAFLEEIMHKYTFALNQYHTKYKELKNKRSVESLVSL